MPCCAMPYRAMPCHVKLCHAVLCHAMPCHAVPCQVPLQAGRGVSQAGWQKGPEHACMGTGYTVLPRSSSAWGMIDLVSANGGLSQCQASAQTGALKGESPFPLRKAEQQSPRCRPRSCSHVLGITGPTAAGSCPAPGSVQASGVPALPG